jgi:hypothetical protein
MAETSANNFWSNPTLEPKRAFRFIVEFGSDGGNLSKWVAKSVSKPGFTVTETPHQYLNHTFYYPGRVEWGTVEVTLVDPVNPDATGMLYRMLLGAGYNFPSNVNEAQATTISKAAAVGPESLNQVIIKQLGPAPESSDPDNYVVEQWYLHNPFITEVSLGDLDYGSEDLLSLSVTLRYDWAVMEVSGDGLVGNSPQKLI